MRKRDIRKKRPRSQINLITELIIIMLATSEM